MPQTLYVDRNEASKILKVSTRTIDRYLRKYRFRTRKDGRRVLIKRIDVDFILKEHIGRLVDINDDNLDNILNGNSETKSDNASTMKVKDIKVKQITADHSNIEQEIYRELYQEVKGELKEKQERLEAATYRVGQLEAQAKSMVPMLDFNKKDRALQDAYSAMDQRSKQNEEIIHGMEFRLRSERIAKWIYLSLVGLLLVAEPILFVLWAFS